MNRRTFSNKLFGATTGMLCVPDVLLANETATGQVGKIPKTDTHVHLFDLENLAYGWLKNSPKINRNFNLQDYEEATKNSNIGKIVFMESGADAGLGLKEATLVSQLALSEPKIKGIVAKADLTLGPATKQVLEQLRSTSVGQRNTGQLSERCGHFQRFPGRLPSVGQPQPEF